MEFNINKVIEFAAKAHMYRPIESGKEFRKGTDIPYFTHPFAVAMILSKHNCSEEMIIAGMLHDCLEDTQVSEDEIKTEFGEKVVEIVKGCSEPNKEDTWENRKNILLNISKMPLKVLGSYRVLTSCTIFKVLYLIMRKRAKAFGKDLKKEKMINCGIILHYQKSSVKEVINTQFLMNLNYLWNILINV